MPATINLENPIESGNIKLIAKEPIKQKTNLVLSNSFGFGGTNTALIFKSIYFFINIYYLFYLCNFVKRN